MKLGTVRLTAIHVPDLLAPRVTDTMEPFVPLAENRVPGRFRGKMKVSARLFEPLTDEELAWFVW